MTNKQARQKSATALNKAGVAPPKQVQTLNSKGLKKKKDRNIVRMGQSDGNSYRVALLCPFSDQALGARVPDQFFAPTATLSLREIVSLSNDSGGNIECIIMPNLYNPAVSFRGNISNGGTLTTPDGVTFANGAILNLTTSAFYSKVTNYRIVSWGVRIRNTTAITNASGVLTVALVPCHTRMRVPQNGYIGGQNGSGAGAAGLTAANWLKAVGIPDNGSGRVDLTSLLELPFHARYQGTQLAEQTFEVHPKMVSPEALQFRDSGDSNWGEDMQATASAVYVQPGDASYLMMDGWTSVVIGFTGGSATAGNQTFDVELIYHVEGSPNVQSSSVFITDTPVSQHNPLLAMLAQAALNNASPFTRVAGAAMAAYRAFTGS